MNPNLEQLPIHDIRLDKTNPRIQRALSMYGDDINAERIALALKEGADDRASSSTTFNRLRNSIIKNKGIITPVIVNVRNGCYVCVEGNTRLLIYRELENEYSDQNWSNIPSLVYKDAGPEQMDAIRLQAHLIGPRQWDPYSKAKYLCYLWYEEYLTHDQIIEYCGGNKKQIQDSIAAYRKVEEVYKHRLAQLDRREDFDHTRFSGFVEYEDPKIHQAVYDSGYTDEDFSMWLHDRKIHRLEHVRKLPGIFRNKEAKQVFLEKNSSEAIKIIEQPSVEELIAKISIEQMLEAVQRKISDISYEQIQQIRMEPDSLPETLHYTIEILKDFQNDITGQE